MGALRLPYGQARFYGFSSAAEVQHILERLGLDSFDLAASPHEALASAKHQKPALITADMRIIGGTGLKAIQAINDAIGEVPAVFVTANADMLRKEVRDDRRDADLWTCPFQGVRAGLLPVTLNGSGVYKCVHAPRSPPTAAPYEFS